MADDKMKKARDRNRIEVHEHYELRYWTKKFGVRCFDAEHLRTRSLRDCPGCPTPGGQRSQYLVETSAASFFFATNKQHEAGIGECRLHTGHAVWLARWSQKSEQNFTLVSLEAM